MRLQDLHVLPKFRDGWSYLYVEHCRVDREMNAIALHDKNGVVPVPCASLALLMLGPGTNITHAAVSALAENGCLVLWCGEQAVRFYAQGMGETRKARNIIKQARLCSIPQLRLEVVRNMYEMRFRESLDRSLNLQQIRGMEGIRVRNAYKKAGKETGVPWKGRSYDRNAWESADPVNRALSSANSCLYGICQAGIVSAGYSPALGFIHIGKMNSFSYDVADLYKTDITIPIAFKAASEGAEDIDRRVRLICRDVFQEMRLLERIIPDIERALSIDEYQDKDEDKSEDIDGPLYQPGSIWDPELECIDGGRNYSQEEE
jgi:CRISP-associated protein Cas1